jgi:hypothetical protein
MELFELSQVNGQNSYLIKMAIHNTKKFRLVNCIYKFKCILTYICIFMLKRKILVRIFISYCIVFMATFLINNSLYALQQYPLIYQHHINTDYIKSHILKVDILGKSSKITTIIPNEYILIIKNQSPVSSNTNQIDSNYSGFSSMIKDLNETRNIKIIDSFPEFNTIVIHINNSENMTLDNIRSIFIPNSELGSKDNSPANDYKEVCKIIMENKLITSCEPNRSGTGP